MSTKRNAKPKCLVPECNNKAGRRRGNCEPCYQALQRQVNAGEITDDELIAQHLRAPRKKAGKASAASKAVAKLKNRKSA